jgi:ABC-2 type transport system ATP-binding protein
MTVIAVQSLTKRFGDTIAVDGLSFEVQGGRVTGFLGPNGSGKTSTLRVLLGLSCPTSGVATFDGKPYRQLSSPATAVGAVVEGDTFHAGRTGRDHLRLLAQQAGLPRTRADEVLRQVDLHSAAGKRVGTYSFGMRQRLGLAAALLGDPEALVLDEAANGLDPEGIHWFRDLMRHHAGEGRAILISSHVLSEVAKMIDDVVIIKHGRLLVSSPLADLKTGTESALVVRTPDVEGLRDAVRGLGAHVEPLLDGRIAVNGVSAEALGALAAEHALRIYGMASETPTLEETYLALTAEPQEVAS